jgi:hypothetical protein
MRIIGKRPVYLASLLLLVATNIWGYFSHSYGSLLASRLLGGFSSAAADATVPVWFASHTNLLFSLYKSREPGSCFKSRYNPLSFCLRSPDSSEVLSSFRFFSFKFPVLIC